MELEKNNEKLILKKRGDDYLVLSRTATSESVVATLDGDGDFEYKISLKNCKNIENSFDLDLFAENEYGVHGNGLEYLHIFKRGFKKHEELFREKEFDKTEMLEFAWFFLKNVGQYSCDQTAHFEGAYFDDWKKKQTKEWEVEIVKKDSWQYGDYECLELFSKVELDTEDCIILKLK